MPAPQPAPSLPSALHGVTGLRASLAGGMVMLDYDGTITPIVSRPEQAMLTAPSRDVLLRLARRCPVAVLSGRALPDLMRRIGVDGLIYAGCHGYEIVGPGLHYEHEPARPFLPALAAAAAALQAVLAPVAGAQVEDKRWAIAVHDRRVASHRRHLVHRAVERIARAHSGLAIHPGKRVLELRPALDWNKGRALDWITARVGLQAGFVLYLGDDRTDEDAFQVVSQRPSGGAGVRIGDEHVPTAARYTLADVREAMLLLDQLA